MSQQINLLLPQLRPRFDWLALRVVLAVALVGIALLVLFGQFHAWREAGLKAELAAVDGDLLNLQQQVQLLGQSVSARQPDAALPPAIAAARAGVMQRREVLEHVERQGGETGPVYSGLFSGLANQAREGVWLVGFMLAPDAMELKGRLLDPAMLPPYIERLNGEPAFAGRRFAALEMTGVDPADAPVVQGQPTAPTRFTEFVLRTETVTAGRGE